MGKGLELWKDQGEMRVKRSTRKHSVETKHKAELQRGSVLTWGSAGSLRQEGRGVGSSGRTWILASFQRTAGTGHGAEEGRGAGQWT